MSIIILRTPTAEHAQALSRGLWQLSRPLRVAAAGKDDTLYIAPFGSDKDGGWIELDSAMTMCVHPEVCKQLLDVDDVEGSRASVQQFVQLLGGQAAQTTALITYITANTVVRVSELLAIINKS